MASEKTPSHKLGLVASGSEEENSETSVNQPPSGVVSISESEVDTTQQSGIVSDSSTSALPSGSTNNAMNPVDNRDGENKSQDEFTGDEDGGFQEEENQQEEGKQKKKRTSHGLKSESDLVYETREYERNKFVKKYGPVLAHRAKSLAVRTGAKVYLKAVYTNSKHETSLSRNLSEGSVASPQSPDFLPPSPAISEEELKRIVADGVSSALSQNQTTQGAVFGNIGASSEPNSQEDLFNSPSVGNRRTQISRRKLAGAGCQVCLRMDEFVLTAQQILIPSAFKTCHVLRCQGRVHMDCLGFPGVSPNELDFPWYCAIHLGCGRPPVAADSSESGTVTDPPITLPGNQEQAATSENLPEGSGTQQNEESNRGKVKRGRPPKSGARGGRGGTRGKKN